MSFTVTEASLFVTPERPSLSNLSWSMKVCCPVLRKHLHCQPYDDLARTEVAAAKKGRSRYAFAVMIRGSRHASNWAVKGTDTSQDVAFES